MHTDNPSAAPSLPAHARLPINRCDLPAVILGSLTFQHHPVTLHLDGVAELHSALFRTLAEFATPGERSLRFRDYMTANFRLDNLVEAGLSADPACGSGFQPRSVAATGRSHHGRHKADYLRMLRGWLFDADGREAAVLKSWVESRFGLLPRSHHGPLGQFDGDNHQRYLAARAQGLYNTNALESQIDLLYTYCQYELAAQFSDRPHITLYRGINRLEEHEILDCPAGPACAEHADRPDGAGTHDRREVVLLLNNLNSFTANRERACEFGDVILETQVPLPKILFFPSLLPDLLRGEEEYLVIGGVYRMRRVN